MKPANERAIPAAYAAGMLVVCLSGAAWSKDLRVAAGGDLGRVIETAAPGTTVQLAPGRYAGPLVIDRPITLIGVEGAVVDGGGEGRVITVAAPGVVVSRLRVVNSGTSLADEDAGIFVTHAGDDAVISENRLDNNCRKARRRGRAARRRWR